LNPQALRQLLDDLAAGRTTVDDALRRLETLPFEQLDGACLDHHRALRCGFPEVIFGQGKSAEQVEAVFTRLAATGGNVLATRVAPDAAALLLKRFPEATYHELARAVTLRQIPPPPPVGLIAIVCAGSSDLPVAEEARVTAEIMDQPTRTLYDVGVAGLHRLLARSADLRQATVLVVVAGMEGALPSVVGGLVKAPVIAVPTSVGYGASFHGLAALLAMLNSCAAGVSVVNIDNGFGAGYQAALINRLGATAVPALREAEGSAVSEGSAATRATAVSAVSEGAATGPSRHSKHATPVPSQSAPRQRRKPRPGKR
jgi:NCAIR mutase (PurE)-related protein